MHLVSVNASFAVKSQNSFVHLCRVGRDLEVFTLMGPRLLYH